MRKERAPHCEAIGPTVRAGGPSGKRWALNKATALHNWSRVFAKGLRHVSWRS